MSEAAVIDLDSWNGSAGRAIDLETEFSSHLANREALVFFLQEGVKEDLLYTPVARAIYAFARTQYERSKEAPTTLMLMEEFPTYDFHNPRTSHQWLADKLRERYRRGEVQDATRKLAELQQDPDEAYSFMRDKVFEIEQKSGTNRHTYSSDDYEHFFDIYKERILSGYAKGFTTGFHEVDQLSGGIKPAQLAFLLARPKRHKTNLLCNAFIQQKRQGKTPILFTLELTEMEIWERLTALITGLSFNMITKGQLEDSHRKIIRNGWEEFKSLGPIYYSRPPVGGRQVADLFMEADKLGADSILIDQFSYLEPTKPRYDREDLKWAEIVYSLKNFAGRQGDERPVFCAAQFNREAENIQEIAGAAKAALTGAIEQVADALYGLHRTKDMKDNQVVQLGLLESRTSDTGEWFIDYELVSETRFSMNTTL